MSFTQEVFFVFRETNFEKVFHITAKEIPKILESVGPQLERCAPRLDLGLERGVEQRSEFSTWSAELSALRFLPER